MTDHLNPTTGEIEDAPDGLELVPLNLGALDEDKLTQLFPTPGQMTAALMWAREANGRAPAALARYRLTLRTAERELKVAIALGVKRLRGEMPKATLTELRDLVHGIDPTVVTAREAVDDAWLAFEYARDYERAIREDIEILRSLNANLRSEIRS